MQGSKSKDGKTLKSLINYITLIMGLVHALSAWHILTHHIVTNQKKNVFDFLINQKLLLYYSSPEGGGQDV